MHVNLKMDKIIHVISCGQESIVGLHNHFYGNLKQLLRGICLRIHGKLLIKIGVDRKFHFIRKLFAAHFVLLKKFSRFSKISKEKRMKLEKSEYE